MERNENSHLDLAKEAVKRGDLITATVEATAAINEDEKCEEAYIIRAQLSMSFGDREGAAKDFQKAAELNPSLLEHLSGEFKNKEENHVFKIPGLKKK
ncbi:MAG: hypothetical protein K6E54_06425 [Bacteroidaceae bacterium]|nr:hypothetical protein [Bacteroidaceae bacterium]